MKRQQRKPWLLMAFALLLILTTCALDKPEDRKLQPLSYNEWVDVVGTDHAAHSIELTAMIKNQGRRW